MKITEECKPKEWVPGMVKLKSSNLEVFATYNDK